MSHFHDSVSRRDFMKGLGLAGAGAGIAAVTSTEFHDIDEVLSSPSAITNRPWWVKDKDLPTAPLDFSAIQPGRTKSLPVTANAFSDANTKTEMDWIHAQFPDWNPVGWIGAIGSSMRYGDIRWDALVQGLSSSLLYSPITAATGGKYSSMVNNARAGWRQQGSPAARGYPGPWQGTPEENLKMMTVAARMHGADDVGAIAIDDNFLKFMWGNNGTTTFQFGDVQDFVMTPDTINPTKVIVPNKCKWFLHWTKRHPYWQGNQYSIKRGDHGGIVAEHAEWAVTLIGIHNFFWSLGYLSLDNSGGWYIPSGYTGTMAGVGEMCRQGSVLSPKFGLGLRAMWGFITDLPLAETKPIDAGTYRFCHTCGICAERCTFQSIQYGDPTWSAPSTYANNDRYNSGYLAWRNNTNICIHCPSCITVCPFSRNNGKDASIHDYVRAAAAQTGTFDSFFAQMERNFGTNHMKNPNDIWDAHIYPGGVNTGSEA